MIQSNTNKMLLLFLASLWPPAKTDAWLDPNFKSVKWHKVNIVVAYLTSDTLWHHKGQLSRKVSQAKQENCQRPMGVSFSGDYFDETIYVFCVIFTDWDTMIKKVYIKSYELLLLCYVSVLFWKCIEQHLQRVFPRGQLLTLFTELLFFLFFVLFSCFFIMCVAHCCLHFSLIFPTIAI